MLRSKSSSSWCRHNPSFIGTQDLLHSSPRIGICGCRVHLSSHEGRVRCPRAHYRGTHPAVMEFVKVVLTSRRPASQINVPYKFARKLPSLGPTAFKQTCVELQLFAALSVFGNDLNGSGAKRLFPSRAQTRPQVWIIYTQQDKDTHTNTLSANPQASGIDELYAEPEWAQSSLLWLYEMRYQSTQLIILGLWGEHQALGAAAGNYGIHQRGTRDKYRKGILELL